MLPAPGFTFSPPSPSASGDGHSLGQKLFPLSSQFPQPPFQGPTWGQGFGSLNPQSPTDSVGQQALAHQPGTPNGYQREAVHDSTARAASAQSADFEAVAQYQGQPQLLQQSWHGGDPSAHGGDGSVRSASARDGEASGQYSQGRGEGDWSAHGVRVSQPTRRNASKQWRIGLTSVRPHDLRLA